MVSQIGAKESSPIAKNKQETFGMSYSLFKKLSTKQQMPFKL